VRKPERDAATLESDQAAMSKETQPLDNRAPLTEEQIRTRTIGEPELEQPSCRIAARRRH